MRKRQLTRKELASKMPKKTYPKGSFKSGTSLPLPPTGLLVAKRSTNLSSKATQGNTICCLGTEASASNMDLSTKKMIQPAVSPVPELANHPTGHMSSNRPMQSQQQQ
ncbi:hypothetical protein DAPPUDRAFT_108041 [Daphnia pulex]|uniref:Uncharacterized protein n=1 Tax=Daphnia pulex TaxID=6669 RepID=E9GYZ8_DAPPU|nr:hypothetical protein DAPPUDRAFT_108041 [Daphnia pulex]|eukprot:EFX75242.1 hypothetical protein DAPPUDRAFT_108041 [Daphnia pulex]